MPSPRSKPLLRAPFVFTTAALVVGACRTQSTEGSDPPPFANSTSQPSGPPGTAPRVAAPPVQSGDAVAPTTASAAPATNDPNCPPKPPPRFSACERALGDLTCTYPLKCQSGTHSITFSCKDGITRVHDAPCEHEADWCEAAVQCWNSKWYRHEGTNPPPPCPETRPTATDSCQWEGFKREGPCGFFCDDKTKWTVGSCAKGGRWEFDDACK